MSETFKKLLAKLIAYNVPFRFMVGTKFSPGSWMFGYTVEDGEEVRIWECDDRPNKEDIIFFRDPEDICDDGITGLSADAIMLHILAREMDVNGVDYI